MLLIIISSWSEWATGHLGRVGMAEYEWTWPSDLGRISLAEWEWSVETSWSEWAAGHLGRVGMAEYEWTWPSDLGRISLAEWEYPSDPRPSDPLPSGLWPNEKGWINLGRVDFGRVDLGRVVIRSGKCSLIKDLVGRNMVSTAAPLYSFLRNRSEAKTKTPILSETPATIHTHFFFFLNQLHNRPILKMKR